MLVEATVTSKGQITLPKAIRERLALKPGKKIRFLIRGDAILIEVAESRSVLDWYGAAKTDHQVEPAKVREHVRRAMSEEVVREMSSD